MDTQQNAWPAGSLFGSHIPLAATLGLVPEWIGDDQARIRLPFQPQHANSRGDVHGGALGVLFDCVLACACRAHDPARYGVVTIDMGMHFLQPCDGDVIATARCEQRGRTVCFARAEAHDTQGRLLALATGSFKLIDRHLQKPA